MRCHIENPTTKTSVVLRQILSNVSEKGRIYLVDQFRYQGCEPLSTHFGKLAGVRDSLKGTIMQLFVWMFWQQQPQNLPPAFAFTKEIIENKAPPPTSKQIIDVLKRKERGLNNSNPHCCLRTLPCQSKQYTSCPRLPYAQSTGEGTKRLYDMAQKTPH